MRSSLAQPAGTISGRGIRWLPCPWFFLRWPGLFHALSQEAETPLPSRGSPAVPYAGTTSAQETCYAHQPLWSAASWKGQLNHALILTGQKVPAFPFYSAKGPTYPPPSLKHREMLSVCGKQKYNLLTRKKICPNNQPWVFWVTINPGY